MAQGQGKLKAGVIEYAGSRTPGWSSNLGLVAALTAETADSIRILGSNGSALSVENPGWITLPSATPGQLTTFPVTANITIDLTGAHWGLGTNGDATDYPLSLYALNNNGSLVWGVSATPHLDLVLDADDSATATDINLVDEVLVSSALSADAQAVEFGWFKADFDDTSGASEDLWKIGGTSVGDRDINLGKSPSLWRIFTPTGSWSTNTTYAGHWRRVGDTLEVNVLIDLAGVPTDASLSVNLPVGFVINLTPMSIAAGESKQIGLTTIGDSGVGSLAGPVIPDASSGTTAVRIGAWREQNETTDNTRILVLDRTTPITFASGDSVESTFSVPITGWS